MILRDSEESPVLEGVFDASDDLKTLVEKPNDHERLFKDVTDPGSLLQDPSGLKRLSKDSAEAVGLF